ncbi:MAG: cysteine hydrolase [Deltaproteobacteria bacterium]|nr:cysteine hydrolase [Deltaproteobacteria bacterium]
MNTTNATDARTTARNAAATEAAAAAATEAATAAATAATAAKAQGGAGETTDVTARAEKKGASPRIAVLTNDLQYELVEKNPERQANVERFKPGLIQFLNDMRGLDHRVAHLQLVYDEGDKKIELHNGRVPVLRGTPGAEIIREFLHPSDAIIEKKKDSGFFETGLDAYLKHHEIQIVIITGMQAQICVQTTAADAHFRGYNVIVPSDGVVSTREEDRNRALEWLRSYCAVVMPMDAIVKTLRERNTFDFSVPALP